MDSKKFCKIFIGIFGVLLGIIAVLNYCMDTLGVLRTTSYHFKSGAFNDRYGKMEYILSLSDKGRYDTFIFGSSRVKKMDAGLCGDSAYNMAADSGMTEDCLNQMYILLDKGIPITRIYLGIDNLSYKSNYNNTIVNMVFRPYSSDFLKNSEYLFNVLFYPKTLRYAWRDLKGYIKEGFPASDAEIIARSGGVFVDTTGTYIVPVSVEENIEKEPETYVGLEKFHVSGKGRVGDIKQFDHCLTTIKNIKLLCDRYNIELICFFNPMHAEAYLADDIELMNQFKKELVKISPFWDFSGINYITTNNYFWYETSHPRAFVCDKILDTVSSRNHITWLPDFGVYVTPENVNAFCEKAVRDREAYDSDHEQWIPTAEERAVMTKRVNYPW